MKMVFYRRYNITSSETYNYTWFRIAKNGTRTVLKVLKEKTEPEIDGYDIVYKTKFHSSRFKFCIVRNPFDRLVSCYENKVVREKLFPECWGKDFSFFIKYISKQNLKTANIHFRLQTELFPIKEMNYIGRFEKFSEEFDFIMNKKLKINSELIFENRSERRKSYKEYYLAEDKILVENLYKQDLKLLGYSY